MLGGTPWARGLCVPRAEWLSQHRLEACATGVAQASGLCRVSAVLVRRRHLRGQRGVPVSVGGSAGVGRDLVG